MKEEKVTHVPGVGTIIENPNREHIMLRTWLSALRLEQIGIQVSRGRKVSSLAKTYFKVPRGTTIPELKERIVARLREIGYDAQE